MLKNNAITVERKDARISNLVDVCSTYTWNIHS